MDLNDPTESISKEVTLTESTLAVPINTRENDSLENDTPANDCNDNPPNDGVNEVSVTHISNKDLDNKKKIQIVVEEESVATSVDDEGNIVCVEENKEEGIISNAANEVDHSKTENLISVSVEKKCETSNQNAVNVDLHLDANHTIYRSGNVDNEFTSDSESDSSTSLSSSSSSDDEETTKPNVIEKYPDEKKVIERPKVKGELGIQDLPPIQELKITADDKVELVCVGLISSIIETLVIVESLESESSPLSDDSILFLEDRTSLGQVFEIFGPVRNPLYSVRFNTTQEIQDKGLEIGTKIYYAPKELKYTNYVFVQDLMKQKGSDASWEHDLEPPEKFLDYSDDEKERLMKNKKKKSHDDNSESDDSNKEDKNQTRRKKNSNNPFYLKNKSPVTQNSKNYKKRSEGVSHQSRRNEQESNPQQFKNWHSNAYTSWPPKTPKPQSFAASNNRFPNNFGNRPSNPSNNWSTNPANQWHSNPANSWGQTGSNNWAPNPLNNWSSTNGPNNWSQNTPNNCSLNVPNNWSINNPNTSFQNTPNSSTQMTPNNWPALNNWTQNNPNSWSQNTSNVSAQNIPPGSSQMNPNTWSSNWHANWSFNPNNLPPPNTLNSSSLNSANQPPATFPNNLPPNAPRWTQTSQSSSAQTQGFLPNSNQWPPQQGNNVNTWTNKPNFNS